MYFDPSEAASRLDGTGCAGLEHESRQKLKVEVGRSAADHEAGEFFLST